ncbi:MAG: hypothetical protein EBR82_58925 [Caulobacteraceae bacterium]|nr:hypothetical protein [Caulobacteraceae bacterium]
MSYTQLPTDYPISVTHGDRLALTDELGFDVTGDTLTAIVYEDTPAGYTAATAANPAPAATLTVTVVTAATGKVTVTLAANTLKTLLLTKNYRWYLRSAAKDRAILAGVFALRAP